MLTRAARRALRYARDELGELASPSSLARAARLTWRFARHDLAPMLPRAARRAWRFARYDLPELAAPSSLPDPPHVVAAEAAEEAHRRALPWRGPWEHRELLRSAWRDYVASFEHSFPGKLSAPESDETAAGDGVALRQEFGAQWKPGDQHELTRRAAHAASTARAGAQAARPVMRELYETRASAYRDGVREFVLGYREAFRDTLLQEAARVQQETSRGKDVPR